MRASAARKSVRTAFDDASVDRSVSCTDIVSSCNFRIAAMCERSASAAAWSVTAARAVASRSSSAIRASAACSFAVFASSRAPTAALWLRSVSSCSISSRCATWSFPISFSLAMLTFWISVRKDSCSTAASERSSSSLHPNVEDCQRPQAKRKIRCPWWRDAKRAR